MRRPVAVATLTLLFALAGRLFDKDKLVRAGRWNDRTNFMGTGLTTRTLGLIGAGSIGKEIMTLARPFFHDIIVFDPYADAAAVARCRAGPFDEVLTQSDFVIVCCLLTEDTRHLINAEAFANMKPSAYYLNVGRGPIQTRSALAERSVPGAMRVPASTLLNASRSNPKARSSAWKTPSSRHMRCAGPTSASKTSHAPPSNPSSTSPSASGRRMS